MSATTAPEREVLKSPKGIAYVLGNDGKPADPTSGRPIYIYEREIEELGAFKVRNAQYQKGKTHIAPATLAAIEREILRVGFNREDISVDNSAVVGNGSNISGSLAGNSGTVLEELNGPVSNTIGDLGRKTGFIGNLLDDVTGVNGVVTNVSGSASRIRGGVDVTHWGEPMNRTYVDNVSTAPFISDAGLDQFLAEQRLALQGEFLAGERPVSGGTYRVEYYPAQPGDGPRFIKALHPHPLDTWDKPITGFFNPMYIGRPLFTEVELWNRVEEGRPSRLFHNENGELCVQERDNAGNDRGEPRRLFIHVDLEGALAEVPEDDHQLRLDLVRLATELRTGGKENRTFLKDAYKPFGKEKQLKFKSGPNGFLIPYEDDSDPDGPPLSREREEKLFRMLVKQKVEPAPQSRPAEERQEDPVVDRMDEVEAPPHEGAASNGNPLKLPQPEGWFRKVIRHI